MRQRVLPLDSEEKEKSSERESERMGVKKGIVHHDNHSLVVSAYLASFRTPFHVFTSIVSSYSAFSFLLSAFASFSSLSPNLYHALALSHHRQGRKREEG